MDGRLRPPEGSPRRMTLARPLSGRQRANFGGGLGEREAERSLPQPASAVPTLNPQGSLRIRRIRELQFVVPEFVDRTRGSKWQSALPTGSKWNRALPGWEGENE